MNYSKIYHLLIEKADNRCILPDVYKENHHVLPKALGGSDKKSNMVHLFPKEHFVAHQLLSKMYPDSGMIYAAFMMSNYKKYNSKQYSWIKKVHSKTMSEARKGENNPMYRKQSPMAGKTHSSASKEKMRLAKIGENNRMFGLHLPDETKKKISDSLKGHKHSAETKKKISLAGKNISAETRLKMRISGKNRPKISEETRQKLICSGKGRKHSNETISKLSIKAKNRERVAYPHCNKTGSVSQMKRWHFNNCKVLNLGNV